MSVPKLVVRFPGPPGTPGDDGVSPVLVTPWVEDRVVPIPSYACGGTTTQANNVCFFAIFQADKNFTATKLGVAPHNNTAGTGRIGLYSVDPNTFDMTMVARTAADASLYATGGSPVSRAMATAGGFPASYNIVKGNWYALASVIAGGTPTVRGIACQPGQVGKLIRRFVATDLPTTLAYAASSGEGTMPWMSAEL